MDATNGPRGRSVGNANGQDKWGKQAEARRDRKLHKGRPEFLAQKMRNLRKTNANMGSKLEIHALGTKRQATK